MKLNKEQAIIAKNYIHDIKVKLEYITPYVMCENTQALYGELCAMRAIIHSLHDNELEVIIKGK